MKKHIVIDARLYGPKHTGIGRYTKNLLLHLPKTSDFKSYRFTVITYPNLVDEVKKDLGDKYTIVSSSQKHYSLNEQLYLPREISRLRPDLVHFTHFNKPILYYPKSIITIHDLIKHISKGPDTTTRNKITYWLKYFFYLLITRINIQKNTVIVPSNFWKSYIIKKYKKSPQDITTTYEAVDPNFLLTTKQPVTTPKKYIIYTGNLYPHKNINVILKALKYLPDIKLKIICARDVFQKRLNKTIDQLNLSRQVEFLGCLPDNKFADIYRKAICLVHPSYLEGFSLTGLEAMSLSCPVISSNSSCLPEIYQDSVLYFDPDDAKTLVTHIKKLSKDMNQRKELISKGNNQVAKYSWTKTAQQTISVYKNFLK